MRDSHEECKVVVATRSLALLNQQADALRTELAALRRELVEVKQQLGDPRASMLVEANEKLVIAALEADSLAETAISDLDELARASQRDVLTNTPNRSLMHDRLEHAIALARRNDKGIAVLFLDLDKFKQVNDTLGHAVGDEVLRLTARRIEAVLRDSDTVSRHGGDEFLVLLADVSHPIDAGRIAEKMISALSVPYQVGEHALELSASIGIALYPEDGLDAATLIEQADAAMYCSKRRSCGGFEFHSSPE